jgi:4-carboxymuconolactone decarboxylase
MSEKIDKGLNIVREMLGDAQAEGMKALMESDGFGSQAAALALEHAFADTWGREGLERKQRSLVTIGILIANRQTAELKNHIRIGINNGLTKTEIEEALIQSIPYAGYPAFASASTAAVEALREMGIDSESKTSEERGLI